MGKKKKTFSKTGCALKFCAGLPGGFSIVGYIMLFVGSKRTEIFLLRCLGAGRVSAEPSLPQGPFLQAWAHGIRVSTRKDGFT